MSFIDKIWETIHIMYWHPIVISNFFYCHEYTYSPHNAVSTCANLNSYLQIQLTRFLRQFHHLRARPQPKQTSWGIKFIYSEMVTNITLLGNNQN
jgi:hypothetical protein